jgi:hypothetical protein
MNAQANIAREIVGCMAELKDHFPHQFNFSRWLLTFGESMGPAIPLPPGKRMMAMKRCYDNTGRVLVRGEVDEAEWFYTEGVVAVPDLPIDIDHAWLSNRQGQVLDFTLRGAESAHYFGIPFIPEAVFRSARDHGHYGMFSDGIRYFPEVIDCSILMARAWAKKEV